MGEFPNVTVVTHPLVQHKLTLLRDRRTPTAQFRQLAREISLLMAYEVTRVLPLEDVTIETPLEPMSAPRLVGKKLCFVSILRAGNGILDGMLDLVPSARVGHIGLYRDPVTLMPVEYYVKLPDDVNKRLAVVIDPMLATAHSACAAVTRLKQAGVARNQLHLPDRGPRRIAGFCRRAPRRAAVHCGDRPVSGRTWIHPSGSRRCGRSPVRDAVKFPLRPEGRRGSG